MRGYKSIKQLSTKECKALLEIERDEYTINIIKHRIQELGREDDNEFYSCHTEHEYKVYVDTHPDGKHIEEAVIIISRFHQQREERKRRRRRNIIISFCSIFILTLIILFMYYEFTTPNEVYLRDVSVNTTGEDNNKTVDINFTLDIHKKTFRDKIKVACAFYSESGESVFVGEARNRSYIEELIVTERYYQKNYELSIPVDSLCLDFVNPYESIKVKIQILDCNFWEYGEFADHTIKESEYYRFDPFYIVFEGLPYNNTINVPEDGYAANILTNAKEYIIDDYKWYYNPFLYTRTYETTSSNQLVIDKLYSDTRSYAFEIRAGHHSIVVYCNRSHFVNGHEWVDLGLPSGTKWATCNIGATSIDKSGNLYSWGEVSQKSEYVLTNYKWYNSETRDYTKYTSYYDEPSLDLSDDAANYNWGSLWRMPSVKDYVELVNYCTESWDYSRNGREYVGRNGNKIFFPAPYNEDMGYGGAYWSASLDENGSEAACAFLLGKYGSGTDNGNLYRYLGLMIRPVIK